MEDIEKQALQTFSKNLEFISKIDSNLSQKMAIFQQAIETGQYKENYALEYREEGYFDVKSLHDGSWLYGDNSNTISKQKADEVTYDKVNSVVSLGYRNSYFKETADDFEQFSAVNLTMMPPIEYIVTKYGGRGAYINKIFKFAFLGLGLGLHVNMIDEKIKAASYFLVEDNIELFYLSLFVTKYYEINDNAKLFFCVLENNDGFKRIFDDFMNDLWIRNDFLKFSLLNDGYANKITSIQNHVLIRPHFAYPANMLFRKSIRISKVLNDGYKFINISQIQASSPLKDKKVLFLAAGPSLSKNIKWVKENRDRFYIVAVFMASAKLKNEGIKPDMYIHIDENEEPIQATLKKFADFSHFEDVSFILAGSVPLEYFTQFAKKEDIYLIEDRTSYKIGHGNLDFYSVGEAGYGLSLILGANELYLLGLDLALDAKTGKTHADGHASSNKTVDMSQKDEVQEVGTMSGNVFSVPANRGGMVPTTPLFAASINAFNSYSDGCLINNQKVYNLSDGALLKGTIPLHATDVVFDEKRLPRQDVVSFLDTISTNELSQAERDNIFVRKQELKRKIKHIKKFTTAKIKNKKDFYDAYINIVKELSHRPNNKPIENSVIFGSYMEDISNFIGEYLNTKEADFSPTALNAIKNKLSSEFRRFVASFGYMDFDYLNPHSYFEPKTCPSLETKPFKLKDFMSIKYPQAKEICFEQMLRNDTDGKLLEGVELVPLEEKKGVGFLATYANLFDEEYIAYLKKILTTLEEATLVAFYFEKYQLEMAKEVFNEFGEKVRYKEINGIEDIVNECRVTLDNLGKYYDEPNLGLNGYCYFYFWICQAKLSKGLPGLNEAFVQTEMTLEQLCVIYKKFDIMADNLEEFGYKQEFVDGKRRVYFCMLYEQMLNKVGIKNIKIDHNMLLKDFEKDIVIKYALKSDEFIQERNRTLLKDDEIFQSVVR